MHLRTIVLFSIGLNLVLGIGWGIHYFNNSVYSRNRIIREAAGADRPEKPAPKAPVPSSKRLDWARIESNDYPTYIQNLRAIGCPENTIRDIIVADVDQSFAAKQATVSPQPSEVTWWKSERQGRDTTQQDRAAEQLENRKRELLGALLGPDWDESESTDADEQAAGVYLGGPILGELPERSKQQVYDIAAQGRRKIESYVENQRFLGQPVDYVHVAQVRQRMRAELAQVLNPVQLEEFLLRYSETANQMRNEFRGLNVNPDEFRNIFRVRDPLETELALISTQASGATSGRVRVLQSQIDNVIQQTLGPDRYLEYRFNQDPLLQATRSQATSLGLPPETTASLIEISQESTEEQQRIRTDANLSPAERIDAMAATEAEQQKALLQLLGTDGFQRWQQLQSAQ